MKVLGAPPEAIDEWQAELAQQEESETIALPLDCRPAIEAFLAVDTQWIKLVAGDRLIATGLDYAGARAAWGFLDIIVTPALFGELQLMEAEAMAAMAERR